MARTGGAPLPTITDDRALGAADIQRSLRFHDYDSSYFNRTPSSAGNRKTFTYSGWLKLTNTTNVSLLSAGTSVTDRTFIHTSSSKIFVFNEVGDSINLNLKTTAVLRDFSAWYHLVVAFDSTQATASNRVKIYLNGTQLTDFDTETYFAQNSDTFVNNNQVHRLGVTSWSISSLFHGYMAEINLIDGYAYDPSYFGFTDPQTGIWMPKRYEGTYGTNGFYLDFSDNSSTAALGIDKSPNGNDWTTNNFSVSDSVPDTPLSNFCTWNASAQNFMASGSVTIREGNLKIVDSSGGYGTMAKGTFEMESGKWYWEVLASSINTYSSVGLTNKDGKSWGDGVGMYYFSNANKNSTTTSSGYSSYGASYSDGDIIGVAFDADNESVTFYKNNSSQGAIGSVLTQANGGYFPAAGDDSSSNTTTFVANFGQDSSFAGAKTAQGNTDGNGIGDFYYSPPSGYKALCSKNLPPTTSIVRPQRHFDTILYTGNGSTGQSITSLEFQPDLIWFKTRSDNRNHVMTDSVRGRSRGVYPDVTDAEFTDDSNRGLVSFDPNGFTVGEPQNASSHNKNGETIVAWCWKAGGAAVTNNDGNNTSQVSANTEAGFSILTYTGNGTNNSNVTMGHGLGKKPGCVIIKNRSSSKEFVIWITGTGGSATDNQKNLQLNATASAGQNSDQFRYTDSSVIAVRSTDSTNGKVNQNGSNYMAYCWADISGYSKFGNYTGNGSYDGPFIHTGFRPSWLMIKNADNSSGYWVMLDSTRRTFNPNGPSSSLYADDNSTENTFGNGTGIDFLSNGFKIRDDLSYINGSGNNMVYMCFAEQPGVTPFDTFPNAG